MKLKQLEVNAFGGINPDAPVVIDFTNSKFIKVEGDNGVNKTSLLNSLLVACGHLSKDNKNFVNNDSKKIDINFSFVGKDRREYAVRCTKSTFNLSYEGESIPEPVSMMKQLLGVVGVSPMDIKNSKLSVIIKWLASYSNKSPEEFEATMLKLKNGIKQYADARAIANKSYKALVEYLTEEPLFVNWADSEKKYAKPIDIDKLSKDLKKAGDESDKVIRGEERLVQLKFKKPLLEVEISDLEKLIDAKKKELQELNQNIDTGEKFVSDGKAIKKKYDEVKTEYDNAHKEVVNYSKWQEILKKKEERDGYETISQNADAGEKQLLKEMKELQAEILPDIKGVELVMEDTHEDGVPKKEGLYWNGRNVAQMSETEWWDIVLLIWRKYKVKVVVIDNYQSLGSDAVDILQKLSKDGCYILAAEMNRQQKTLQIDYNQTVKDNLRTDYSIWLQESIDKLNIAKKDFSDFK